MKKQLPVAILALVVLLCSASAVSAQVDLLVTITPTVQYASPQISQFLVNGDTAPANCQADKTVTYNIFVQNGEEAGLISVAVNIGNCDISWFDNPENVAAGWSPGLSQTISLNANEGTTLSLYINVPLTLGKDAGGTYDFVVAAGKPGSYLSKPATLVVQDHDYVSETLVVGTAEEVTITENYRNMAIATEVEKVITFSGTVDCLTKNVYVIKNAKGNNANYEQEAMVNNYRQRPAEPSDLLYGDERFKSCAAFGGTGADIHEIYAVNWMESRSENLNHHVTGDQKLKTELCTRNTFDGELLIDARQSVPCSKRIVDTKYFFGNLTAAEHIILRRP